MKAFKKSLALLLCLVMLIGMVPSYAAAADDETPDTTTEDVVIESVEEEGEVPEPTEEGSLDPVVEPLVGEETADAAPLASGSTQTESSVVKVEHEGTTTYYDSWEAALDATLLAGNNNYGGAYVYTLLADAEGGIAVSAKYATSTLDVTLDLNGHTISGDGTTSVLSFTFGDGTTTEYPKLTIKDSSGDNSGKITGGTCGVVFAAKYGVIELVSGTITGNTNPSSSDGGGGIKCTTTTATVYMTGGVISNNSVTGQSGSLRTNSGLGGGVYAVNFVMTGGIITGNYAYSGGATYGGRGGGFCTHISGASTVSITGGEIYGNYAECAGDDIMLQKNGNSNLTYTLTEDMTYYVDGFNGTKQSDSAGVTDRYSDSNLVEWTTLSEEETKKTSVGLKVITYNGPTWVITYTDGVAEEEIFADQIYKVIPDKATPAFKGIPERYGYKFLGWTPEVAETATADATYTATWEPLTGYTVTYTDGVEGEEVFADQVYTTYDGYETPAFAGTPSREHYIFTGWTPEISDTVTATVTYTATWREAIVYTITYTDGVEDEEVFPDQVYQVEETQTTPDFVGELNRVGYYFSRWNPTVANTVSGDATYTAVWSACSHTTWSDPVFDAENLTNTYTCTRCGYVKTVAVVAQIGEVYYENLQAALDTQKKGTGDVEIDLLADTNECVSLTWTQQKNGLKLTIDLNGHTITGTGSASVMTFKRSGNTSSYKWNIIITDSSAAQTGTITGGEGSTGGAITVSGVKANDSLTINGGNFTGNTATTGNGGAIYTNVSGYDITINNGSFINNTAKGNGGAISGATVIITGGTFGGNTANGSTGGGAVYGSTTLTVSGGAFTNNSATAGNGGALNGKTVTVSDGSFTGNSATGTSSTTGRGGAIYSTSKLTIRGGTITGNSANGAYGYGGGVCVYSQTPTLSFTGGKIYGNTAFTYGDDIVFQSTGASTPTLSILAASDMGVSEVDGWYVDGFCGLAASNAGKTERFGADYVVEYVQPSSITKSIIAVKAAKTYTVTYTDGVEDEEIFADQAIKAVLNGATPAFEGAPTREGYLFAGWTPEVAETVTGDVTYTATWKLGPAGDINGVAFSGTNMGLSLELHNVVFYNSVVVEVYCGETLLTTITLKDGIEVPGVKLDALTVSIRTAGESSSWTATAWTAWDKIIPDNYKLYIDGDLEATYAETVDADTWAALEGTVASAGDIIRAWLNKGNGRIMVDLEDVAYTQSVALELYSGETLLTSATLNAAEYPGPVTYGELTGSICVENYADSDTWVCTAWQAWDGVVPTAIKLVVDGEVVETYTDIYSSIASEIYVPMTAEDWTNFPGTAPAVPDKYGDNVTAALIRVICDSDPTRHEPMDIKWQFQSTEVYPKNSIPVWDEELGTWTIGVKIDSITVYYIWMHYEKSHNDILHDPVIGAPLPEDTYHIVTNLKWDAEQQLWVTMDGKPIEIHTTCKTAPTAPEFHQVDSYQIKVTGMADGEDAFYFFNLIEDSVTIGEVKGSREEGFTVDVTVSFESDDGYVQSWLEKRNPNVRGGYHYSVPESGSITFTLKYNGDLTGELHGHRHAGNTNYDWVLQTNGSHFGKIGEAYIFYYATVTYTDGVEGEVLFEDETYYSCKTGSATPAFEGVIPEREGYTFGGWSPEVTEKVTGNVTYTAIWVPDAPSTENIVENLVTVICDSDETHADVYGKWYPQNCEVKSDVVWDDALGAWTVSVRIDSIDWYYVHLTLEDAYNDIHHELVGSNYVDTTLLWDAEQELWIPTEVIEVHAVCQTAPTAPTYEQLSNYQIKVWGTVNGEEKAYTTSMPEGTYTISEVKGSREEGFTVDVTLTIAEGDAYITNWVAQCDADKVYLYDWTKTPANVTFTLKYSGDLNGTLHGDGSDDWALSATGNTYGVVGEAYVKLAPSGKFNGVIARGDNEGLAVELEKLCAYESVEVKVYCGDELLTTVSWREEYIQKGVYQQYLTCSVRTYGESTQWGATEWAPMDEKQPTKLELHIDGTLMDTLDLDLDRVVWAELLGTVPPALTQDSVTSQLVSVICDSDSDRHTSVYGKWYPQNCSVYPSGSSIEWNEELKAWTVGVRVDSIDWYYVHLTLEDAYNDIHHELVGSNYVDTTLVWDESAWCWVTLDGKPIEVHATCQTVPTAPTHTQLESYQIKVWGTVNGEERAYTTSIPEGAYTIGEVKGSREEGFTVDVTLSIAAGDVYITNWVAKHDSAEEYMYDWAKTPATITYTLKYNGDLNGTLYGDRHASNTSYDWVLSTTGNVYGVVAEAYVKRIPSGEFNGAIVRSDNEGLAVELQKILAYESVEVKVYCGDELLTTVSWRDEYIQKGTYLDYLTCSVRTYDESTQWVATEWTPMDEKQPTKLELYIDGTLMDTLDLDLERIVWAELLGTVPPALTQDSVTDKLVAVTCDSDEDHETVYGKWYPQNCSIRYGAEVVWNEELGAYTVDVRVDSIDWYYVHLTLERAYNNIHHELVGSNYVDTTLVWDESAWCWVTLDGKPIEVHAICQTAPTAPTHAQLESYQIKVHGDLDGDGVYGESGESWTTSMPEGSYVVGEVKGNREEGFTVDVTIALEDGDAFITNWIAQRAPGESYAYDWSKTPKTVTFTLEYNGSLTGTLYGDRHASNTNYDWILPTTGKTWGVIDEAYVHYVVAHNVNTNTYYTTLAEALDEAETLIKSGEGNQTVELVANASETVVMIYPNVTLDLKDHVLTANYVHGFKDSYLIGDVYDADGEYGKLIVDPDNFTLAEGVGYVNENGRYVLPVWSPTDGSYLFSEFVVNTATNARGLRVYEDEDRIYFQFKHQATGDINRSLLMDNGASDNELKVVIRLEWTNDDGVAYQDFVYNDEFVQKVADNTGASSHDYTFTLNGYSALNINLDTLTVTALIITESGATAYGETWTTSMDKAQ